MYAYPLLETVGKDYADHIRNKALLSYESAYTTERLAEYLAEEILQKEKLEWVKETVDKSLKALDEAERLMVEIRYFGKRKKMKRLFQLQEKRLEDGSVKPWSERMYFRKQKRLLRKIVAAFRAAGLSEEEFCKEYASLEIFQKIAQYVAQGRDRYVSMDERRWMQAE